jgi:hypothetical protein
MVGTARCAVRAIRRNRECLSTAKRGGGLTAKTQRSRNFNRELLEIRGMNTKAFSRGSHISRLRIPIRSALHLPFAPPRLGAFALNLHAEPFTKIGLMGFRWLATGAAVVVC